MSKPSKVPLAELRPKPAPFLRYIVYTCPELGRTCNRPNAYDAFDLPSVYAGERKPYRFSMSLP